jgi:hypothetical protein
MFSCVYFIPITKSEFSGSVIRLLQSVVGLVVGDHSE